VPAVGEEELRVAHVRVRPIVLLIVVALLSGLLAASATAAPLRGSTSGATNAAAKAPTDKAVFFASDGLRQDLVQKYAGQGVMPTMADFLKKGASATGGGLLTQAPPNTGAGWYTLATGAWPGVHGSTNNTFHINGQPFGNSTSSFAPNVLQVESIA
jgi:predicted AlkP superfamily pyrophosphatase or phosphodiesterase